MRKIKASEITEKVRALCISAAYDLGEDVASALRAARGREESPLGKEVLGQIIDNFEIARGESLPMCQDTGIAVFFVELGRGVELDGPIEDAINEGVRQGYRDGYLRKSVCHPIKRVNTGDNTPAVIHISIVEGEKLRIKIAPRARAANMSGLKMLKPAEGVPASKSSSLSVSGPETRARLLSWGWVSAGTSRSAPCSPKRPFCGPSGARTRIMT